MRIGLFGGAFDPIHMAHIRIALDVKREFRLDKVFLIPSRFPPHKRTKILAPAFDRLRMIALSIKRYPELRISRYEINKKTTSFSFETVKHFKSLYPKAEIFFIIGSDSLNELKTWRNIKLITKICSFIVAKRKGIKNRPNNLHKKFSSFLKSSYKDISSSKIRKLVKTNMPLNKYLEKDVINYIKARKLYR